MEQTPMASLSCAQLLAHPNYLPRISSHASNQGMARPETQHTVSVPLRVLATKYHLWPSTMTLGKKSGRGWEDQKLCLGTNESFIETLGLDAQSDGSSAQGLVAGAID
ncbi:hypothetical protein Landi51_12368 [Colletotrichum acutatum]